MMCHMIDVCVWDSRAYHKLSFDCSWPIFSHMNVFIAVVGSAM